jgi:hypothetical protein
MLRENNREEKIFKSIYITECFECKELIDIEICNQCVKALFTDGKQGNIEINESLFCKFCFEIQKYALCPECREKLPRGIILDTEPSNHLQKECDGDIKKLKLGLVGMKTLELDEFLFFKDEDIEDLKIVLYNTEYIIGYNLVGHNGLDYKILNNYGVKTDLLIEKTYDLMTVFIRVFGSYKNFNIDNIAIHTLGVRKKKNKKANYKLLRNGEFTKVMENLKRELKIIEILYSRIIAGESIRFKTPAGLINEYEIPELSGMFPEYGEDISDPYDFPFTGIRLEIKNRYDFNVKCEKCEKTWRIRSTSYYGDTLSKNIYCPGCDSFLQEVKTSVFGENVEVSEEKTKNII